MVSTVPEATGEAGVIPRVVEVLLVAASNGEQKRNRKALITDSRPSRP
jgi:hypothetical protein